MAYSLKPCCPSGWVQQPELLSKERPYRSRNSDYPAKESLLGRSQRSLPFSSLLFPLFSFVKMRILTSTLSAKWFWRLRWFPFLSEFHWY